jgi:Protein of unknown function (DUF2961)
MLSNFSFLTLKPNSQQISRVAIFYCIGIAMMISLGCSSGSNIQQSQPSKGAWYEYNESAKTRWSSPENLNGNKGAGGMENDKAKGHAFDAIDAGASRTLLDIQGAGIINRIWITVDDRSPEMLRSLKLEMFWDNQDKPAVSTPLGDFFGMGLGRTMPFHNAAFANPEGKSFSCFIPMPFKSGAKIRVVNESRKKLMHIFFDVDFQTVSSWQKDWLYFHAYWSRDTATTVGKDFELLPGLLGKGRFMGVNVGINSNPLYEDAWWGEGEVKIYLDEDKELPTLVGTGTEDYIGTGWGQGVFSNDYSGCLLADAKNLQWTYYRFHIPDPVYFESACRVTIQQIGGNMKGKVIALQKANVPLVPVTIDQAGTPSMLYQGRIKLDVPGIPDGWTNFYRSDDVSSVAYFYLDKPASNLPALQPLPVRIYNLKSELIQLH